MKKELLNLIQKKSPGAKPLLLVIRGSHAYGTNIETSDTDFSGVFIQSMYDILGFNYIEQINDDKNDIVIYEIKRFLQLLESNNPTVLELLNTPDDCIIYKDPVFDEVLNNKNKFITKLCAKSFGGYAVQQIQKAKGQNKKQNWEKERVTRKDVLDFVYVIEGEKSIPWKVWCIEKPQYGKEYIKYETKFCGIVNVPHAKDLYTVYHDEAAQNCFSENISKEDRENNKKYYDEPYSFGYKGLVKTGEGNNVAESNALRLSSIPKGETPICNIFYNKDGYSQHCREYKEYEEWLEKRNTQRWVDVESHGQKIDGKNMMHCKRLTQMSKEIAQGLGINVRRPDAESLIDIRKGKIDLETLINDVENEIIEIDELFKKSTLPDKVDRIFVNELLVKIRKNIYNI